MICRYKSEMFASAALMGGRQVVVEWARARFCVCVCVCYRCLRKSKRKAAEQISKTRKLKATNTKRRPHGYTAPATLLRSKSVEQTKQANPRRDDNDVEKWLLLCWCWLRVYMCECVCVCIWCACTQWRRKRYKLEKAFLRFFFTLLVSFMMMIKESLWESGCVRAMFVCVSVRRAGFCLCVGQHSWILFARFTTLLVHLLYTRTFIYSNTVCVVENKSSGFYFLLLQEAHASSSFLNGPYLKRERSGYG